MASDKEPANLQSGRMTVKQAAELAHVSERMVYMARRLKRVAPELMGRVESGELTINAALILAGDKKKPTAYDKLVKAWNQATEDDRVRLLIASGVLDQTEKPKKGKR